MRWTSRGRRVMRWSASTIGTPNVRLGTKWPSITSQWSQSAPSSARRTAWSRRDQSADRMDGETSMAEPSRRTGAAPLLNEAAGHVERDVLPAQHARAGLRILRLDAVEVRARPVDLDAEAERLEIALGGLRGAAHEVGHDERLGLALRADEQVDRRPARHHGAERRLGRDDEARPRLRRDHAADRAGAEAGAVEQQAGAAQRLAEQLGHVRELLAQAERDVHRAARAHGATRRRILRDDEAAR